MKFKKDIIFIALLMVFASVGCIEINIGDASKLDTQNEEQSSIPIQVNVKNDQSTNTESNANIHQQAEEIASKWLTAVFEGDADMLIQLSDTPFLFDGDTIDNINDLETYFKEKFSSPLVTEYEVKNIEVKTLSQIKNEDPSTYEDLKSYWLGDLSVSDNDLIVSFIVNTKDLGDEGIGIIVRNNSNDLNVIGFFD